MLNTQNKTKRNKTSNTKTFRRSYDFLVLVWAVFFVYLPKFKRSASRVDFYFTKSAVPVQPVTVLEVHTQIILLQISTHT